MQSYKVANAEDTENRRKEIAQLQEKLLSASRVESRYLKARIDELRREETHMDDELARFDDLIARK